ncbi:MAG TPA: ABC transporter substrate-binding protein [Polyangiaceae bacterium]|nr:ABC transporter substrate-binding protein [Polyangiaceae bacterium]
MAERWAIYLGLGLVVASTPACKGGEKKPEPAVEQVVAPATPQPAPAPPLSAPLSIGYSDWPGFVALEVPATKGWFKEAGLDVKLVWFEYVPSLEAFQAGKLDAVGITNGDQLVIASSKTPSTMVLLTDYSNGNDMIVAKSGIDGMAALRGKKIGVEVGFVDHLLLLNALKMAGMKESDVSLVNVPTDQTPQALKSGSVDAIAAWQPSSGNALAEVAGSKAIHTSAEAPGLIYDGIAANPDSFASRKQDWIAFTKVWYRTVDYINDPKNRADVLQIMSARVGLTPEKYEPLLKGTFLLNAAGNVKQYAPGGDLYSVYFSDITVNEFNVANKVYAAPIAIETCLDPSVVQAAAK